MEYHNAYEKEGCIFKKMPSYTEMPNRRIITNLPDLAVCDNAIKTNKYTILDFIPLNLIVQFSKLPNIYFLVIGIMQMIPSITISGGFPVIFIPLSFVVGVSAVKDFYEDLKRKNSDDEINNSTTQVLTGAGFDERRWSSLRIGDIIKVSQNNQFPADIILLQSSEQKLNCFIETKNLDGQTNLKSKQVKFDIGKVFQEYKGERQGELYGVKAEFNYERPNPFIYSFTGSHNNVPLDTNHVILRGCSLKITSWVTGLVIYTGVDTKIMLNSNKSRVKKSRLEFRMGLIVIGIFVVQMLLTFAAALTSTFTTPYVIFEYKQLISHGRNLFIKWGSWVLLFTNFVPISLIVSLEMVKYIQGTNISTSTFQTTQPAEVRVQTSTLNEELGQIQHLFTDKTGTLTKNYMSFKYMVIGSDSYGYDKVKAQIPQHISNVDFHDQSFFNIVNNRIEQGSELYDILISFALCHNVIIEEDTEGRKRFNASSPDELAFINMAKLCGWEFQGVNANNQLVVTTPHGDIKYKILHTIQFNSDRKRMSVILEKDDRIFVYCKGADNIILDRLKTKNSNKCRTVNEKVEQWSLTGLRTLLFAKREVKKKDYEKWAKMYAASLSRLEKVEKQEKEKVKREIMKKMSLRESTSMNVSFEGVTKLLIEDQTMPEHLLSEPPEVIMNRLLNDNSLLSDQQKIFIEKYLDENAEQSNSTSLELEEMLEKEFELIGATAIEDQLQDNVKETIQVIRQAGVKVWMLTGDKKETAINIGVSCGLVSSEMAIVFWRHSVEETLRERQKYGQNRQCCLVATGEDLLKPMEEADLLRLVESCKAVICCRVTPKQKQDMVWLMRKNKCTTLGIGDGANDVNMINTAHVGVGIKGVEGAQAALCSDYAISEFQILRQLMLYHGRQSYRKNSQLILFNFYKNLILVLPQLWYGFNNHFSSATIYDPWVYQLYNVLFTSFPIIIYAIFDQQYSVRQSLSNPKLYEIGLFNQLFNLKQIMFWFTCPIVYAYMLSAINFDALQTTLDSEGYMLDLLSCGMTIFASCVIICNLKLFIISYSKSYGQYLLILLSIAIFYLSCFLAEKIFRHGDMINLLANQIRTWNYWASIFVCVSIVLLFQYAIASWNFLKDQQFKKKVLFQEIEIPLVQTQTNQSLT